MSDSATVQGERRSAARAPMQLEVTLARPRGAPVEGHTVDLSAGGTRVATTRPLQIYELLAFEMSLGQTSVSGSARVLRMHPGSVYALRFEGLPPETAARLERAAHAASGPPGA